jgi:hypothetical protein
VLWLNPLVLSALGTAAVPILIHLLVQRRAPQLPFPTLRFLRSTRLASVRHRVLDDVPLLAVRCAIVSAAVAALAGPLAVTSSRRADWDRRIVRAVVVDGGGGGDRPARADAFREQQFSGPSVRDGIARATAWLDAAPPARRELLVVSAFPIGSIGPADLASVPADVGISLERRGVLARSRAVAFGRTFTADGVRDIEVTLAGAETVVRDRPASGAAPPWPIDVVAPPAARRAVDAAVAAVRERRVWTAPPERRARLVIVDGASVDGDAPSTSATAGAAAVHTPWIADATARVARDRDLQAAARRTPAGMRNLRLAATPWHVLARAGDGTALVAAAESAAGLLVVSAAPAASVATPILIRATADALADRPDIRTVEIVPIRDDDLRAWSRPAQPLSSTRLGNVDEDDRRWFWAAVLLLLGLEMWMRRAKRASAPNEEAARVA